MSVNEALSRIFLVSSDSKFSQNLITSTSSNFLVSSFKEEKQVFDQLDLQPSFILWDMETKAENFISFSNNLIALNNKLPIILLSNNQEILDHELLAAPNIYQIIQKKEINNLSLHFLQKNITHSNLLQFQVAQLTEKTMKGPTTQDIIHSCEEMQKVMHLVNKASSTDITCYILGEQGTGKGEIAYLIHYFSPRKSSPYLYLKLSTIESDELEKELFGIEDSQKGIIEKGKLELAAGGTIYIEDIHLMPITFQVEFLKALKLGYFQRINGSEKIPVAFRLIASTPENLQGKIDHGYFSESLYYYLMRFPIIVPALKDRGNDIILLATHFMDKFSEKNNFPKKKLSKDTKYKLLSYSFPGNIRELKSTIERAVVLADHDTILEEDIEFRNTSNQISFLTREMTFEEYKSKIIHHFLSKYDNDIQVVSTKLDIGKSTIYRMLKSEKEKSTKKMSWFNMF